MLKVMKKFGRDDSGATAIEYGLIAGLIAVGLITVLSLLGPTLAGFFTDINTQLTTPN